jgi:GT2 family glycosyltransferase
MSETQDFGELSRAVNVIMVSRDLWEMTRKAMETLIFTMSAPWQFIFINNGSRDETREAFEAIAPTWSWQFFNGYQAYHYSRPVSLAAAWNRAWGMRDPNARYTLFANNDIVWHKFGWWDRMREVLDGGLDLTGIQEMTWYKFRFIQGSLFAARTDTFQKLEEKGKLFDTRFKLSCEDVDLSERFLRAGLKIAQTHGLQPEWLVHIGHQTLQHFGATEDLVGRMRAARKALCKKWGYPEQVED